MEWQAVGTISTSNNYVYTPIVNGVLFKLKHIRVNPLVKSLKIIIRQAFEDNGIVAFYDYKLIAYKTEVDIVLFSLPNGLTSRRLAIKRADTLLDEDWSIEIEQMSIIENGIDMPITLSDIANLQLQLNNIQAELTLKALDLELDSHVLSTENPHIVTLNQLGGESVGTAQILLLEHELSVDHPVATTTAKGMITGEDKSKLDNIESFATLNSTDTYLLDRSKHMGEQAISTIANLLNILGTFVNLTTNEIISGVKSFNNLVYLAQHLISNSYISAQNFYLANSPLSVQIERSISGQNHYCADIGYFNLGNGGVSFRLNLIISDSNFSIAKSYTAVTTYQGVDSGWLKLIPEKESIYLLYNNCEIDIKMFQGVTYLRVRRSGGNGDVGNSIIRMEFTGARHTYFEETFATTIDSTVTGSY